MFFGTHYSCQATTTIDLAERCRRDVPACDRRSEKSSLCPSSAFPDGLYRGLEDLCVGATTVLFGTYFVLAAVTLAGFVWMIVTVARGRSPYPRWVAVANPIVMMVIGSLLSRVLPPPFSIWLDGAGLNLGMLFFMA